MSYQPVIIIGAPRSGTNMLRDVLTSLPGIETWPCDEINYIWRHGNVRFPHDAIPAERGEGAVGRYIRRQFDKLAAGSGARVVVEKTCANSVRVPFVDRVVPDAKYLFIVRDGVDVVGSSLKRWTARLDLPYLAKKARFVPPTDLPYYGTKYVLNRIHKLFSSEKRLAVWGPRTAESGAWQERYTLPQVCALQWQACIEAAERDLGGLGPDRVQRIRYEAFVEQPVPQTERALAFIGQQAPPELVRDATRRVSPKSIGRGRAQLGEPELAEILPLIESTLHGFGYAG